VIVTTKEGQREFERRSCDSFMSVAFSFEEMYQDDTKSLANMGGNLAEIQKELVSLQIYVFQVTATTFVCLFVCFAL